MRICLPVCHVLGSTFFSGGVYRGRPPQAVDDSMFLFIFFFLPMIKRFTSLLFHWILLRSVHFCSKAYRQIGLPKIVYTN